MFQGADFEQQNKALESLPVLAREPLGIPNEKLDFVQF